MPNPKLLQIVPRLSGGIGRATLDAAQAVIAAGGSAVVASPGGPMLQDLLRLRASHIDLAADDHPLLARLTLPARLTASTRELGLNIIQSHTPTSAWIAGAVARRLKIKWIATLHRPLIGQGWLERYVENCQGQADALLAVSEHVAHNARRRLPNGADKIEIVPTGVNIDRFDPAIVRADRVIQMAGELRIPDGAHVVLCPGRFSEDRGQKTLIEAIRALGRDDVFCLLLGSTGAPTALEKDLERTIEQAGLQGRMQIGPYVDDMPAAYMLADVVVATGGARLGFSRTMVEAQAMGRPVVAEAGGGAAESILPGVTGWTAPAGDAMALAEALNDALSLSIERRGELARKAQENVRKRYGLADASRRLLAIYHRLSG